MREPRNRTRAFHTRIVSILLLSGFAACFMVFVRLGRHDAALSDQRRDFSPAFFLLYENEKGLERAGRVTLPGFSFSRSERDAHVPFDRYAILEKKDTGWRITLAGLTNSFYVENAENPDRASYRTLLDGEHPARPGTYVFQDNLVRLSLNEKGDALTVTRLGYLFFLKPGEKITLGKSLDNQAIYPVPELTRLFEGAPTTFLPGRWIELSARRDGRVRVENMVQPSVSGRQTRLSPRLFPVDLLAAEGSFLPLDKTAVAFVQAVTVSEGRAAGNGQAGKDGYFHLPAQAGEVREIPLLAIRAARGPERSTALWVVFDFRGSPLFPALTQGASPPVPPLSTTWNNPMRRAVALPQRPCVLAPLSSQFRRFGARQRVSWEKYDRILAATDQGLVRFPQKTEQERRANAAYADATVYNPECGVTIRNNVIFDSRETVAAPAAAPRMGDLAAANARSYPFLADDGRERKIFLDWPARKNTAKPVYLIFHEGPGLFAGDGARLPAPARSRQAGGVYLKDWDALGVTSRHSVCVNWEGRLTTPPNENRLAGLLAAPSGWSFLGPRGAVAAVSLQPGVPLTRERSGLSIRLLSGAGEIFVNGEPLTELPRELRYGDVVTYGAGRFTLASNFGLCLFAEKEALPKNDTTSQMVRWSFASAVDDGEVLNPVLGILGDEIFDHASGRHAKRRTLFPGLADAPDIRTRLSQGENVRLTLQSDLMEIVSTVSRRHLAMLDADYPYPACRPRRKGAPCLTPSRHGLAVLILNREGKIRASLSLPTFTRESLRGGSFDRSLDDPRNFTFRNRALQLTRNDYPGSIFKTVTAMCWLLSPPRTLGEALPGPLSFDVAGPERIFMVPQGDIPIPPYTCTNHLVTYSYGFFYGYEFGPRGIACVGNHAKRRDRVEFLSEILYKSCNQGAMRLYAQYAAPGTLSGVSVEVLKALGFRVLAGSGEEYGPTLRFARDEDGELTRLLRMDAGVIDVAHLEQYPASLCKMAFGQIVEAPLIQLAFLGVFYADGGDMYLPTYREDSVERVGLPADNPLDPDRFKGAARHIGDALVLGAQRVGEPGRGLFQGTSVQAFSELQGSEEMGYPVFAGKTSTAEVTAGAPAHEQDKAHTRWLGWQAGRLVPAGDKWTYTPISDRLVMAVSVENSNNEKAPTHAKFLAAKIAYATAAFFGDFGPSVEKTCASK